MYATSFRQIDSSFVYLKVFNIFQAFLGSKSNKGMGLFLKCPGHYHKHPYKVIIFNNGTVSKNVNYGHICKKQLMTVHVAYEAQSWGHVFVDNETDTIDEHLPQEIHENTRLQG